MKIRIILSLLLVITIACSKDSAEPETLSPESTISMALDYQSREYELGEVIEATLTITEKKAATNFFLLNTSCNGGKAAATVDGRELQWQTEQQIPYEIVNDEFSSKILHLKITPQAGALAEQSLNFRIYVTSADGTEISDEIYANSINSASIAAQAVYQSAPIELEQQLEITLCAGKEQFTGEFTVKPTITEGDGYLILDGQNYHSFHSESRYPLRDTLSTPDQRIALHSVYRLRRNMFHRTNCTGRGIQSGRGLETPERNIHLHRRRVVFLTRAMATTR